MNAKLILLTKSGTKQLKIARNSKAKRNLKIIKEKVKIAKQNLLQTSSSKKTFLMKNFL